MDPVTLWLLGGVVAPDAYTRVVSMLTRSSSRRRLAAQVRRDAGIRTGFRYHQWLRREQTRQHLMARRKDAYDRLVDSLVAAEARGIIRRRPDNRARATALVNSTIANFLPTLDPSLATAVSDFRAECRHQEVLARFDASKSFEERLDLMPPAARDVLARENVHRGLAERVVEAVLGGEPQAVVASLVSSPPDWLIGAPAVIHLALAQTALSYGLREEAAQLFERVAELGLQRPRWYAKAAFEFMAVGQRERAQQLLDRARLAGADTQVDVVAAALDDDWDGIIGAIHRNDAAAADPFIAHLYAVALQQSGDREGAIGALSRVVGESPEYTGVALRLAQLLLERSMRPGTTSRPADLQAARELSERARDLRRKWRGDSREAVELACRAALVAGDYPHAVQLGTLEPDGLARPEEAAEPEVQFLVAQAAIASGDLDTARQVAAGSEGFHQALIMADLFSASNSDQTEITAHFMRAWDLAATEEQKVAFWLSASMAGMEPLPGDDELRQRTDDLPEVVQASQHIARGRLPDAIELLRANRQSEHARQLLVNAYVQNGQIDDAVAELLDMAARFDNANHQVRAVELLVGDNRVTEAAELADRTLPMIPPGQRVREFLHEVGVAAASSRAEWPDMEARTRAWINERGADRRRRWLLVKALWNQADPDAAWQVAQQGEGIEPETAVEAELWIALHSRYRPSGHTLTKILELCERFPEDADIRASAVNAFFLMGDHRGEIAQDQLARWHELIQQRAENPSPDDAFISISVSDDPEDLIETLRPLLEPQAQQVETWLRNVREEGWPYGMLAVAAGRPYTTALVHRAAGFLPITSENPAIAEAETRTALAAFDHPVVADISSLAIVWYLKDLAAVLGGLQPGCAHRRVEVGRRNGCRQHATSIYDDPRLGAAVGASRDPRQRSRSTAQA